MEYGVTNARADARRSVTNPGCAGPVCGLILAAGEGSRFADGPKLLAELDGIPLLAHPLHAMCSVEEIEQVVVVLGAHAEQIRSTIEFGRAQAVVCDDWREGLAASLRCGIRALGACERVIVTLGDAPTVTRAVIERLMRAPAGARASYRGVPGHPVLLGASQLLRVPGLAGDRGARELLDGPLIECSDLADGADVDTQADLVAVRALLAATRRPRR